METVIFYTIIGIIIFEYILTEFLWYLNAKNYSPELPTELKWIYDEEKYKKSQAYEKEKYKFSIVEWSFELIVILLALFLWFFGFLDDFIRTFLTNELLVSLFFIGSLAFLQTIINLPFSYYSTFVIEEKYDFNKSTKKLFFLDILKSLLLSFVIGWLLLALIIWIYNKLLNNFWLYAWGVITIFSIFMMMFYSNIIVPLFNKQVLLEDGELKQAIQNFSQKVGFRLENVYVMDGSKRSSKANAYFSGLGPKKRIVLYDTLIKDMTSEEIVAVLAHEIGHYKKKHTLQMLAFSIIQTGFMLYILWLALWIKEVSLALGASEASFHIGAIAFSFLFTPLSILLGIFWNVISRRDEYQADEFAGKNYNPESLQNALKKLSINNLSNLRPHPAYEFFYYSHPTVLKRLQFLEKIKQEK
jgi:STE24 endopeptidase